MSSDRRRGREEELWRRQIVDIYNVRGSRLDRGSSRRAPRRCGYAAFGVRTLDGMLGMYVEADSQSESV